MNHWLMMNHINVEPLGCFVPLVDNEPLFEVKDQPLFHFVPLVDSEPLVDDEPLFEVDY